MIRQILAAVALVVLGAWGPVWGGPRNDLIPETTAARHGLTRPWFTQVDIDAGRGRVCDVVLDEGTLFVQTDLAMLTAIHAETGQTLWVKQVGRRNHPSMTPGFSRDLVAIVNGSRLYAVNRHNGDLLYETLVGGAPGAGAALSDKRAYVPMVSGMVMAYRLQPLTEPAKELGKIPTGPAAAEKAAGEANRGENLRLRQDYVPPLYCQSAGRALVQPLIARQTEDEEYIVWPTDRGFVNIARVSRRNEESFAILFQLRSESQITTRPTYMPADPGIVGASGVIYATTIDGYVYAILEKNGSLRWRFSTSDPIVQPAVVIDDRVYVAVQTGGMYCLEARSGRNLWFSPDIVQFLSAGRQRVYAVDKFRRLLALNAATGARLDTIPASDPPIKVINTETDRLYLASDTGMIQCLRELEQLQPLLHNQNRQQGEAGREAKGAEGRRAKKPSPAKEEETEPAPEPGPQTPKTPKKPVPEAEAAEDPFTAPGDGAKGGPAKRGAAKGAAKEGPAEGNAAEGKAGGAPEDPFGGDAAPK
jgi:outer membrane protein assembly factor BamB